MTLIAFPHSEIPGSKLVCSSPRLIAADHVFHRLSAPRHPPYTLSSLTTKLVSHAGFCIPAHARSNHPSKWTPPKWTPTEVEWPERGFVIGCSSNSLLRGLSPGLTHIADHSSRKAFVTLLSRDFTLTSLGLFRAPIHISKTLAPPLGPALCLRSELIRAQTTTGEPQDLETRCDSPAGKSEMVSNAGESVRTTA